MPLSTINVAASVVVALLVHEAAHLLAARACNVTVTEAGLGWGPKVFGVKIKGISYQLRALPLGAFVRMDMLELQCRPLFQQLFVLLAGVGINLAFGLLARGTFFGTLNMVLAIVNLFPLYQQDGWKSGVVIFRWIFRRPSPLVEWCFTVGTGALGLAVVARILLILNAI